MTPPPDPTLSPASAAALSGAGATDGALAARSLELDLLDRVTPAEAGELVLRFESGATASLATSSPADGVVRLTVGRRRDESPMLAGGRGMADPGAGDPAGADRAVADRDGAGLAVGPLRTAPPVAVLGEGTVGTGRLVGPDGATAGWQLAIALAPDAEVYGGGSSFQGPRLRGRRRTMRNAELHGTAGGTGAYLNVPLLWSDAGWGVFVHTAGSIEADLGATHADVAVIRGTGADVDIFVLPGDGPTILRRYHALTGLPGALPEWALGTWSSRCSYLSEAELHEVVDGYEAAGCPVDVVHVDAWLEGDVVADLACSWRVDRSRFPEGWAGRLAARGVRTSLWHNPYAIEGSELARRWAEAGMLLRDPTSPAGDGFARTPDKPDRVLLDLFAPGATSWWRSTVAEVAQREGVHAFKPDFGEEVPATAVFADGRTGEEARGEYALVYQRATHQAMSGLPGRDGEPVALFCRSGTAGSQQHPVHWVGDTPSTWEGLASAVRACLSLSLSGFGAVAHDVGGFFTPGSFERMRAAIDHGDPSRFEADVDPELFLRWAQWGALSPVQRFHGTGRREPWAYHDPWGSLAVEACRRRAELRADLVAAAGEAATTGAPMLRPMAYAHPGDRSARAADLQHMLGASILVAPLLEPGGRRSLWAPPGRWAPIWGLEPIEGPAWVDVECALDQFPAWRLEQVGA